MNTSNHTSILDQLSALPQMAEWSLIILFLSFLMVTFYTVYLWRAHQIAKGKIEQLEQNIKESNRLLIDERFNVSCSKDIESQAKYNLISYTVENQRLSVENEHLRTENSQLRNNIDQLCSAREVDG